MDNEKIKVELVNGCEGKSIYINDYRVAGSKPWGGGRTEQTWVADKKRVIQALDKALGLKKIICAIIEEEKAQDRYKGDDDYYCAGVDTGFEDAIAAIERYFNT